MKRLSSGKKQLLLIFNSVLTIVIFVITYFLDPLKYTSQSPLAAIPAFLLSIVVLIIGQNISTHNEVEKVSEESAQICETVKNYLHVIKMGTPKYAWGYIINRLSILEYVQNTSFNFDDEIEQTQERLYSSESYILSINRIAKSINRGLIWRDVGDVSAIDRFEMIKSQISEKSKGQYQFKLVSQSEPQLGFIILTYKDGATEVLFNWDFRDIPKDPVVLLSRDPEIVDMFAAQYKGLWKVAVEDYDNKATKSTS